MKCKIKREFFKPALIITILTSVVLILFLYFHAFDNIQDDYVAQIEDEKVYRYEFQYFIVEWKYKMMDDLWSEYKSTDNNVIWLKEINGRIASDVVKEKAFEEAVNFKVQEIQARKEGIKLDWADRKELDTEKESVKNRGDDVTQKYFYMNFGLKSEDEYIAFKKNEKLVDKLKKNVYEKISDIPESEALEFYYKNLEMFTEKDIETFNIIVLDKNDRDKALKALGDLRKGNISFEEAAGRYSVDERTRGSGGLIRREDDKLLYGSLLELLDREKVNSGEISSLIDEKDRYYILRRNKAGKGKVQPFERVKQLIYQKCTDRRYEKLVEGWKDAYEIVYRKEVYDAVEIKNLGKINKKY